jgi:hypothetical protein
LLSFSAIKRSLGAIGYFKEEVLLPLFLTIGCALLLSAICDKDKRGCLYIILGPEYRITFRILSRITGL